MRLHAKRPKEGREEEEGEAGLRYEKSAIRESARQEDGNPPAGHHKGVSTRSHEEGSCTDFGSILRDSKRQCERKNTLSSKNQEKRIR